jgi:demethylmenaquinone methyltransferase/2-methoxy-6-polyprenyl-1,4-benzoquinol methylase
MTSEPQAPGPEPLEAGPEPAWFGDRSVPAAEKPALVRGVFASVAGRYDLMNDLMSGGIHRLWKTAMIGSLLLRPGQAVLDVAGGTGDIAQRVIERWGGPEAAVAAGGRVIVCDLTPDMVALGRDRAIDRGWLAGIEWVVGDAERLPLPDDSVDRYAIAFGLRNVTCIDRALAEARRVLKPGGRFVCLEFSRVALPWLARAYEAYSFQVLPTLGALVVGDAESYRYLAESIRRFPGAEALAGMIAEAGLEQVRHRLLSGGIAALHTAWRL